MISSQDFRNCYEKFYDAMRYYLWPYDVLEQLGLVEEAIYSSFIDIPYLRDHFNKLSMYLKDVIEEDAYFSKCFNQMKDLIESEEECTYLSLPRVQEMNPEIDKVLKNPEKEDEDIEVEEGGLYINEDYES